MKLKSSLTKGLHGTVIIPGDKSISHRALILGAISQGKTYLHNFLPAEDCLSTLEALQSLGVTIHRQGTQVIITGQGLHGLNASNHALNMGNSGTATRLLAGLLAGQKFTTNLYGDCSLSQRPMQRISQPLHEMGADIELTANHLPMIIRGKNLHAINYQMNIASAQVKSALILGALQANKASIITELFPTRDHTERLLRQFGGKIITSPDGYTITVYPQPHLSGQNLFIAGDMSSAAFFITAASIVPNSRIRIMNVGLNPTRIGLLHVLKRMGGKFNMLSHSQTAGEPLANLEVESASLQPITLTAADIPSVIDELPLIALLAAHAQGISYISGAGELRVKETDRITALVTELSKLGIDIAELDDGFIINGSKIGKINNTHLDSHGDHRIGMMLAVAALTYPPILELANPATVNISYPAFFQDLNKLLLK